MNYCEKTRGGEGSWHILRVVTEESGGGELLQKKWDT